MLHFCVCWFLDISVYFHICRVSCVKYMCNSCRGIKLMQMFVFIFFFISARRTLTACAVVPLGIWSVFVFVQLVLSCGLRSVWSYKFRAVSVCYWPARCADLLWSSCSGILSLSGATKKVFCLQFSCRRLHPSVTYYCPLLAVRSTVSRWPDLCALTHACLCVCVCFQTVIFGAHLCANVRPCVLSCSKCVWSNTHWTVYVLVLKRRWEEQLIRTPGLLGKYGWFSE